VAEKIRSREELAREDTWAIEDLYETDEAWLSDLEKLKALGARLPGYAGKLSADAKTLLEYQRLGEEISLLLDRLANYAQRKSDEDTRNPVYQDLTGRLTKVWVQLGADTAFEVPELLSISDEQMEKFYRDEPDLQLYRRHFDVIRRKKEHILSEREEKLLAMAGEMAGTPEEIYNEPENAFVADFIGDSNIIDGVMMEDRVVKICDHIFPCIDEGFGKKKPVDVVIRPEDIIIGKSGEGIMDGVVTSNVFIGVHYEMCIEAGGYEWLAQNTTSYPVGMQVSISVTPENIQIMNKPQSEDEEAITLEDFE